MLPLGFWLHWRYRVGGQLRRCRGASGFSGNLETQPLASRIKDSNSPLSSPNSPSRRRRLRSRLRKQTGLRSECSTSGKDCETKGAKVSFWFNGSKLVEMEMENKGRAGHVRGRRLSLAPDGKTLQMEVIPITPEGEVSLLAFDKAE